MACSACERRRQKIREMAEKAKQKLGLKPKRKGEPKDQPKEKHARDIA